MNTFKKFHSADAVAVDTAAIINESFMVDVCCVIVLLLLQFGPIGVGWKNEFVFYEIIDVKDYS